MGAGNSATFEGTAGNYIITFKDTQSVDILLFLSGTYSIIGGVIRLRTKDGIYVAASGRPGQECVDVSLLLTSFFAASIEAHAPPSSINARALLQTHK
ncbi:MAG: hypothetical protein JW915_02015 [Chitinispirillaceae bacterium]|nr:hypothetical protein [Chitinispirillaceae bacterium]